MKVLIADDEYHVIEAINLLVPWEQLGIDRVLTAGSVAESKVIINNEKPEIVIMDIIMNDQTGIDLMQFINSEYPATKAIAISGHNDFEYVRAMLTSGSIDYLLKPLDADALVRAVTHAIDAWNNDHRKSINDKQKLHQISFLSAQYAKTLLSKLLNEITAADSYRELTLIDPKISACNQCTLLFYNSYYFPMEHSGFSELLPRFEEDIEQYLSQNQVGTFFRNQNNANACAIFLYDVAADTLQKIQEILSDRFGNQSLPIHLGRSACLAFPAEFRVAYFQAENAFFGIDSLILPKPITSYNETEVPLPPVIELDSENQMLSALLTGNPLKIEHAVTQWLAALLPADSIRLFVVQNICKQFQESLSKWIALLEKWHPYFKHDSSGCGFTYSQLLNEKLVFSPHLLKAAIVSDIQYLFSEIEQISSTDVFRRIACHLELNFRQPFNQSEYARLFYLNKDYMCRQFKKVFNVSMVSYLNLIRIEQAKKMMYNSNMIIRDIANQVGFEDEKYFSRQFKQITGISPSEYRGYLDKNADHS